MVENIRPLYIKALISKAAFVWGEKKKGKETHADMAQLISETASNDAQLF